MTWKKNGFSYLTWFLYTLMTGGALLILGSSFCAEAGLAGWWGIPAAVLYLAIVGGVVFLFHRKTGRRMAFAEKNHTVLLVLEWFLAALFFAAGVFLRVNDICETGGVSEYFTMAEVVAGQQIPRMVHGAEYFYVQVLHAVLLLFGNQYAAGLWLQMILQLTACLGLYFLLRRMTGKLAALVSFGFCMCAPYMVQHAVSLSPDMLYFLLVVIVAAVMLGLCMGKLRMSGFVFAGILTGFCCYVDIGGVLLLILGLSLAFMEREEADSGRKPAAVGLFVLAMLIGFLAFIGADAFFSGKNFWQVLEAWFRLYQAESFRLPVSVGEAGSGGEAFLLFGLMAFGIFGFWRDRKQEYCLPYVAAACGIMLGACYGIFTEEMPGFYALYILFAILAGISLKQSLCDAGQPEVLKEMSVKHILAEEAKLWEVGFAADAGEKAFFETADGDNGAGSESGEEKQTGEEKKVRYLDNPLPLPKKHVKHVLDYAVKVSEEDDFDHSVGDNDDYDI